MLDHKTGRPKAPVQSALGLERLLIGCLAWIRTQRVARILLKRGCKGDDEEFEIRAF